MMAALMYGAVRTQANLSGVGPDSNPNAGSSEPKLQRASTLFQRLERALAGCSPHDQGCREAAVADADRLAVSAEKERTDLKRAAAARAGDAETARALDASQKLAENPLAGEKEQEEKGQDEKEQEEKEQEEKEQEEKEPEEKPLKGTWVPISKTAACEVNSEAIVRTQGKYLIRGQTEKDCMRMCQLERGCTAIDW
jgi:hypothetical protein